MTITVDAITTASGPVRATTITAGETVTFSHAGAGSGVKGALVAIMHGGSVTDHVPTSVTYGGVLMTRIRWTDSIGSEPGATAIWFLGSGVPQGTQTVGYTVPAGTTDDIHSPCVTLLADSDLESIYDIGIASTSTTAPSRTMVNTAKTGTSCMAFAALYSSLNSPSFVENGNCTRISAADLGSFSSVFFRQTTAQTGTASFAIGGTCADSQATLTTVSIAEISLGGGSAIPVFMNHYQ
jgi:hypothetical protein